MSSILAIGYTTERIFKHFLSKGKESSIVNIDVLDLSRLVDCQYLNIVEDGDRLQIIIDDDVFDFRNYFGFYNRCFFSNTGTQHRDFGLSKTVAAINSFLETTTSFVVNKHSAGSDNGNKFIHIQELKYFGFATPKTFICGSSKSLQELHSVYPNLINKSCSSIKTIATKVDDELLQRGSALHHCPSLFQEQIAGPDVRIHVVGDKLFPEMIVSDSIDYRYNENKNNKYSDVEVPDGIRNLILDYCFKKNLFFAGVDFKIAQHGKWFILEVNPMPGYEGYDKRLNGDISACLLNLFLSEEKRSSNFSDNFFIHIQRRPDVQAL